MKPTATVSHGSSGGQAPASLRDRVSPDEWSARVELAALYRAVAYFRWTDMIFNHISFRVHDRSGSEAFLINPFGYLYEEVTASSLVKIDLDGNILDDPTGLGINQAGFIIHGAVHQARPEAKVVLHTHTRAGAAVSAQEDGLLAISQHASVLIGRIAYHEFEGIATRAEERVRLVENLGDKPVMILRNHGLLFVGRDAAETFGLAGWVERACEIQIAAMAGGARLRTISTASIEASQAVLPDFRNVAMDRNWAATKRLLDRVSPGYDC